MTESPERRELSFNSMDEVIAEVDRLASGEVRTRGNRSFGQILNLLALGQDAASGRAVPPPPPFFMRLMMPLMKGMIINAKPLKPGIKLPPKGEEFFWPDREIDVAEGVKIFKESLDYYNEHGPLEKHPFFGKLTKEQNDQMNRRHAALHLSFVHPA